ncbi:hypothetical protein MUG91_G1931n2 [Manis pentadactyla]|nr:hypothetical protein MUG91_G1931n2 [Manis pentadactyla]
MVPPLPESKANECALVIIMSEMLQFEQNAVLLRLFLELFEASRPYTEWNAMECGGMLPNGVQLRMECKEYSGMYPKEVESCGMQCNRV